MGAVRGSADFGALRSWAGDYDGGDLGSVVRASRPLYSDLNPDDAQDKLVKNGSLYNDMFTRSECLTPAIMAGKLNGLVEKAEINDQRIIPICTKKIRQEERASKESAASTLSAAPMSVNLKSPARFDSAAVEDLVHNEVECTSSAIRRDSNEDGLKFVKMPGTKRRKAQQRRIMCVPAAGGSWNKQGGVGVPSDLWAWRKYGQKPIKGSPHPRGYYRCSSSKGCPARKQIERSHTDPSMLVITYTADHNHAWPTHRNALAGSTRQNAFQHKVQKLPVPNTNADQNSDVELAPLRSPAKDNPPDPTLSPINESQRQERGPSSTDCVNSLDLDHSDAGFDVFSATHDDDLFADLGELPEYLRDFTMHSDEETASKVVDPFNLFDWSSSTME